MRKLFVSESQTLGRAPSDLFEAVHMLLALQQRLSLELNLNSATLTCLVQGGRHVDLALRLNVLAVFAVFAFVGAILLGAF